MVREDLLEERQASLPECDNGLVDPAVLKLCKFFLGGRAVEGLNYGHWGVWI